MLKAIIVDDEAPARSELRFLLDEVGGVDVAAEAASVREAIEKLKEYPCDVMFLDVNMPEATGESAKPFTMGGATYARHFASAASFGPEMPWLETPEWVGGMHGPDEGVSEEQMKKAFRIYALTIGKLMEIDFAQQRTC